MLCARRTITTLALALLAPGLAVAGPPGPEQRVTASDADNSDRFGHAVDIDGDVAVIGAPGDDEEAVNAGAAYVFRRVDGIWVEEQKLTAAADAVSFDEFGTDVAVERDLVAVGSPGDDDAAGGGSDSGAVYLFEFDGSSWVRIDKLLPDDPNNAGYTYGTSVDLAIDVPDKVPPDEITVLAVGAPRADTFQGLVFLYQRGSVVWDAIGRLSDSDVGGGNDAGELGTALAIRGDALIVGAPLDDQLGNNTGAAYHFGRGQIINSWAEAGQYYPSSPVPGDMYGAAVAVDRIGTNYTEVIGAPSPQSTGSPGRVFIQDTPGPQTVLTAGGDRDGFGSAVGIDGDRLVVGAPFDDDGGPDAGAVYFYVRDMPGSWSFDGKTLASDAGGEKEFGTAVDWRVNLLVGGPEFDALTPGAAYFYVDPIFVDGFESGDTSAWSSTVP